MKSLEYVICNFCGNNSTHRIAHFKSNDLIDINSSLKKLHRPPLQVPHNQLTVVCCRQCGLFYLNPRLNATSLKIFYEGFYSHQFQGQQVDFNHSVYATTNHPQELGRLSDLTRFRQPPGQLLDIGAGPGHFLYHARLQGWEIYGQELSRHAAAIAKKDFGVKLFAGSITDLPYPDNFFDVITMHSVLEHLPDPASYLKICYRKLKPGGLLVFNIPNLHCFEYWVCKFLRLTYPGFILEHLYYFTPQVIHKFLRQTGFEILTSTSYHHSHPLLPDSSIISKNQLASSSPSKLTTFISQFTSTSHKWLYFRTRLYQFISRKSKDYLEYNQLTGRLQLGSIIYIYAQKVLPLGKGELEGVRRIKPTVTDLNKMFT